MQKPRQAAFFRPSFSEFDYFDEDALRRMHVKVSHAASAQQFLSHSRVKGPRPWPLDYSCHEWISGSTPSSGNSKYVCFFLVSPFFYIVKLTLHKQAITSASARCLAPGQVA